MICFSEFPLLLNQYMSMLTSVCSCYFLWGFGGGLNCYLGICFMSLFEPTYACCMVGSYASLFVCLSVCLSVCLGIRLGPYWLVRLSKVPVLASFLLLAVANSSTVSMCSECSCWLVFARLLVGFFTRSCLRKCMSHV